MTSCSNYNNRPCRTSGLTFGACKRLPPPTPKGPGVSARHSSGASVSCDNDTAKKPLRGPLFMSPPSADASALLSFIPMAGLLPPLQQEFLGALRSLGESGREGGTPRDVVVLLQPPPILPLPPRMGGGRPWLMMMIQSSAPAEAWDRLMQSRCEGGGEDD